MESLGVAVTVLTLDVVKLDEAKELIAMTEAKAPLAGIFHLALNLDDRLMAQQVRLSADQIPSELCLSELHARPSRKGQCTSAAAAKACWHDLVGMMWWAFRRWGPNLPCILGVSQGRTEALWTQSTLSWAEGTLQ